MRKIFFYIILALLTIACGSSPRFTSVRQENEAGTTAPQTKKKKFTSTVDSKSIQDSAIVLADPSNPQVLATETGIASYYAEPFHGRKTANGEIYNMYELTAAHPTYPLGTIAKVTNLKNGKTAIVKINDRMPKRPDRIIDLSYGTAVMLGMVKDGITKVKIEVLKWGDNKYHSSP